MKILYVEDNDDNAYMLKNRLSRAGFTVIVATNAAQGIAMASSEQPDLILMDVTLPDIDGEEATRRIKADPATKQIPVIALTANAMAGDKEKALAAGCDDFDTKPVEMSRLLEKIKSAKTSLNILDRKYSCDLFCCIALVRLWHWAVEPGCPHSRRVSEGKRSPRTPRSARSPRICFT